MILSNSIKSKAKTYQSNSGDLKAFIQKCSNLDALIKFFLHDFLIFLSLKWGQITKRYSVLLQECFILLYLQPSKIGLFHANIKTR
uniref:Uncharacterized protein n=1 Tax=Panagrolaimus sp. ES5 TaxID=591445 RepID=A0AC34F6N3_9BILA